MTFKLKWYICTALNIKIKELVQNNYTDEEKSNKKGKKKRKGKTC